MSTRLQALLIVVLATTFLLMPGWMGRVAERIVPAAADWRTAASPPMWFVGLHQVLAGRVVVDIPAKPMPTRVQAVEDRSAALFDRAQPGAAPLARTALAALVASFAVAVAAFLWNARRPAARARTPQRGGVPRRSLWVQVVTATVARTPAVQAGFFFALRTLGRSVPHRAALAVASAFGLAVATIGFGRAMRAPAGDAAVQALLWTQTMFLACLLAGCEQAMRLPAHLPASWSLKLAWPGDARGYVDGVKRAMVVGVGTPALALLLLAQLWFLPPRMALAHFAVGLLVLLIAIEARFIAEHPLPFLTSYVAGSRVKVAPIWLGAAMFVSAGPVEDRVARPGGGHEHDRPPRGARRALGRARLDRTPHGRAERGRSGPVPGAARRSDPVEALSQSGDGRDVDRLGPRRPGEGAGQFGQPHRLRDEVVHPGGEAAFAVLDRRAGGQRHDRQAAAPLGGADAGGRLVAVHLRHQAVHQHDVEASARDGRHGFGAVAGDLDAMPELRQHPDGHHLVERRVLGQQDREGPRRLDGVLQAGRMTGRGDLVLRTSAPGSP